MSVVEELRRFREQLAGVEPTWSTWSSIEALASGFRPYLRKTFPDDIEQFDALVKTPKWVTVVGAISDEPSREHIANNNQRVVAAKDKLVAFIDGLARLLPTEPDENSGVNTANQREIMYLPFRPYKWFRSQSGPLEEYHSYVQTEAINTGVEEQALQAIGGRPAVLQSIRRHQPSFNPAEATEPNAPAWIRLKPLLSRCGLIADENTTLLDIKTFLDDTSPSVSLQSEVPMQRPSPDPRRAFVIYGRNTRAYDQMVKFLRSLKLDPRGFYDLSADCGPNPTVLRIVRHGMEQAAGVVALFTADEWSALRPMLDRNQRSGEESQRWQARPNVIFEAGMAMGIAENRTILVKLGGEVRLFSDVGGIHTVDLNNGPESRNLLRGKLRAAGCVPDMETVDHLNKDQAGDFESCLLYPGEPSPNDPFAVVNPKANPTRRSKK